MTRTTMKALLLALSTAWIFTPVLAQKPPAPTGEATAVRTGPEGLYALWYQKRENAEVFLQQPYIIGGQMVYQWRDLEPKKGKYDFSKMAAELEKYGRLKIYTTIQINGNLKPDWLFEEVPYHTTKFSLQVRDEKGSLMYWHPTHKQAYIDLLKAFADFVRTNRNSKYFLGIRQNFNGLGTEHIPVPAQNQDLAQWIVPDKADRSIALQPWTKEVGESYETFVLDNYIQLFSDSVRVFVRNNISTELEEKYKEAFNSGKLCWFHTSSEVEPHAAQVEKQYRRFIEYCRSGRTVGYAEPWASAWGHHAKTDDRWCSPPQWFYWTQLNNLHCGVSYIGIYSSDMQVAIDGTYNNRGVDYKDGGSRNYQKEFTDTLLFTNRYVGYHHKPAQSPGAWVAFRENDTILAVNNLTEENRKLTSHTGDYNFLMERLPDASYGKGITNVGPDEKRFGAWARVLPAGETMKLRLDPVFVESCRNRPVAVRVTYYDRKGKDFEVVIQDTPHPVKCTGQDRWETKVIEINGSLLNPAGEPFHLSIRNGAQDVVLHMVEVTR